MQKYPYSSVFDQNTQWLPYLEISKLTTNKRIFISQASLQLIKDFHELEFLFASKQENKVTENDKEVINELAEFAASFYDDLNKTQNLPNSFIVPETQPTNNSNQILVENQSNSSQNNAQSNLTLLVNELQ